MPRPKAAPKHVTEYSVRELLLKHDIDPLEEMVKLYQEELPWPEDGDGNTLIDELKSLLPYWEPGKDSKGRKILRLKTDKRIELLKELTQYVHPKLRGAEVRGNVDYNINVTIKSFDAPKAIVDSTPAQVVRQAITDAIPVEEDE